MRGFNVLFPFAFHATGEPILGVVKRLEKGDQVQKKILMDEGITEKEIDKFKDPKYIVRYWQKRIENDANSLGLSVDWRRKFTTIDPCFNRFIEWQYNYLKEKGYVVQGTHPVVWCPNDQSPTGDHDRLEGVGEGPIEYIAIKFRLDSGEILPTATLRPETVFGVTNIWVRPDAEYIKVEVDGENWIIAESAIEKLKDQLYKVKTSGKIKGKELVGKYAKNPLTGEKVIILPASFVDLENATGIVMSVPSHAPYDWIALKDLQNAEEAVCSKYGISKKEIEKLKPISVISTPGLSENSAVEICNKLGIKNQFDKELLEKATNEIYKKEFHQGVLNERTGKYKGMAVSKCKKELANDFKKAGHASSIWELTNKVICRCGSKTHVKILENQWFLKFSDPKWKELARKCVQLMKFYPEQARKQFEDVIEWLEDKACARKSGMGTRLPWDKEWIVETLSDSVIYMAFYTIAKYINEEKIESHYLKEEVFDYIFWGKGDVKKVAKSSGLSETLLKKMREEFDYWYGQDMRASAKELIPNHFTFSIFHHVAVWPNEPKRWPHAYTINGMQQMNGQKMSKSKGNFITIQDAINKYSADAMRITLMDSNEGMEDPDWTEAATLGWKSKLNAIYKLVKDNYNKSKTEKKRKIDVWIESRLQNYIKEMTLNLEKIENKSALIQFHLLFNDIQWYMKRGEANKATLNYILETLVKLLSPFTPFLCEEIWSIMGKKRYVSLQKWPEFDEKLVDKDVLQLEEILKKTCDDLREVIKLSQKNERAYLYVVSPKELDYFKECLEFLKKEFGFKNVEVFLSTDKSKYDPEGRASRAKFGKPGIFVE